MKNALVILAGGKGKRFGQKIPKQFLKIGNTNFLNYFISNLDLSNFDIINISIDKKYQNTYLNHKVISDKIKIAGAFSTIDFSNSFHVFIKVNALS